MNRHKCLLAIFLAAMTAVPAMAQSSGTNTSYSRFGVGLTADQSQGFNRSMGGVAQGLRYGNRVNKQNPASYSAIDSLTFIFDVGISLQRAFMHQGNASQCVNNTSFDYVNMGFRLAPHLGFSLGFLPYSSIGYSFDSERKVTTDAYTQQSVTQTATYSGDGGIHEIYAGIGWEPFKGVSIGVNASYLWGNLHHFLSQSFSENGTTNDNYNALHNAYLCNVKTWKLEAGLQYSTKIAKEDFLNFGFTAGIGHKINNDALMLRYTSNGDTITRTVDKAYQLPMTYSAGVAWNHADRLTVALDYTYEGWAACVTPRVVEGTETTNVRYEAGTGDYKNRHRINAGVEYCPSRYHRRYGKRINYRFGAFYATPNLMINGQSGPKEFGISAGLGLPIMNVINRSSLVNFGLQWVHRAPGNGSMITENYYGIKIGLTFSESWFMKWKFQ
ncbi:MAG: hypothetical protein K6F94_01030 [Bacteroidaceae bacterium]|nr:hypothetical protein [Bacteroidaceae bacterium]